MARGFDHIAHAVRDLDAAADLYRRAGFIVGSRNRHPPEWGTQNHIVQVPGCYIEILGLGDMSKTTQHGPRSFSFGAFSRDFLARGHGLAMLALEGRGAPDAEEFRAAGIGDFELFELERETKRPDGSPARVAFSLAFARDPNAPDTGFFTCRHHHPENFWNPAFQNHPNTVCGVAGVVLVAENPEDHRSFLSVFAGERDLLATPAGLSLKTPRGEIQVMTPPAFQDCFDAVLPDISRGARLAALRFKVRNLEAAEAQLQAAELGPKDRMGRIVLGPETALGATLVFEGN